MANYHQVKNAAILTPTGSTDLGSDSNRYSNVFMSGNIMMSNGVTVTSTNVITPKIASVAYPGNDTAADIAGGQTITITGTGFSAGASVLLGTTPSTVVTVISSTSITFTSPALSAGNYALYVINSDGGTAIYIPGIAYSGTPVWSTSSGNIASVYETSSISSTVVATGDATISYSLNSGTLPTGSTLNSSTGLISGTAPASAGSTTYSFSIRATDGQNQDTDRSFTITVNTDAVIWSSPADNTSTALTVDSAMSNVTLSASASSGQSVAYTANALPTGLSISGANVIGTPTVVGSTTSLITATAANSNRTATRTLSWVVAVGVETYWPYVTLLINGEGAAATNNANNNTYVDSSTNAYAVTTSGSPIQGTFSPYSATSWSNYFSGSSLTIPTNAGLDLGSGAYTVEAWFNINELVGQQTIISFLTGLKITVISTGLRVWGDAGQTYETGTATINAGTWYHMAWVRQSTSLGKLYLDGVLILTVTSSNIVSSMPTGQNVLIGTYGDGYGNAYYGHISNLRVVKGTAVYTSAFTPSTTPLTAITNTTLLTCQSNRFIDNSTTNASLSTNNAVFVKKFTPFNGTASYNPATYGGSAYFNGSSYLTISSGNLLNVSASDNWTAEAWIYPMSSVSGYRMIFQGSGVSLTFYDGQAYYTNNAQGLTTGGGISASNQWYHVAWVNNASVSSKIYINGVQTATGGALGFTATATFIGASNGGAEGFIGYIADMRIVRGTAVYTGSFTPPTAPLTAIANTALLISATNAGIIDQTGQNNITTSGDAKISTAVKKYNSGSVAFDGTGDGLLVPSGTNLDFGTGNFTIEMWVNFTNATSTWQAIISRAYNISGGWRLYKYDSTNELAWYAGGTAITTTGSTLASNTWAHIAVVRNSGTITIYINGVNRGSGVEASSYNPGNYAVEIGKGVVTSEYPVTGYIDDLRLTRGYARYTATFTPPTQALLTS